MGELSTPVLPAVYYLNNGKNMHREELVGLAIACSRFPFASRHGLSLILMDHNRVVPLISPANQ